MAGIRVENRFYTETYSAMESEARALGDKNDCAVKAVALVTGISYQKAHQVLQANGRKIGKGTLESIIWKSLKDLGHVAEWASLEQVRAKWPERMQRGIKSVTTYHGRRFPGCFPDGKLLAFSRGHVSAIIDGEVHDWAIDRSKQIFSLYKIVAAE